MQRKNFTEVLIGDTFNGLEVEVLVNALPKNLTGVGIDIWFRKSSVKGTVLKMIKIGTGITVTDAVNGIFQIDAFVVDFTEGLVYYDIELNTAGVIKTYLGGTLNCVKTVTNG